MPAGRPPKYKKEFCEKVIQHMSTGDSLESFAVEVGVDVETIQTWKKKYPEFLGSVKRAEVASMRFWESLAKRCAMNATMRVTEPDGTKKELKNFNPTMIIFMMKSRFRGNYGEHLAISGGEFESPDEASLTADDDDNS